MWNNIKKTVLIVSLFIGFSIQLMAQTKSTISGFVRDSLSSEPLVGVVVADGNMRGTTTNQYGFFSITVTDTLTELSFSHIGYKTKTITAKSKSELNVKLVPSALSVDEVFVDAENNKFTKTTALGITSINSQQLDFVPSFMGEKDIFKYFQLLPGVNPGKEGSSGMNLRGGSSDQTLILMDDIPIYNHSHAFGFVSIFSGDYIKSAELYKGYSPPQYGGRLSGVATMNIREGNRNKHNQSMQLGTTTLSGLFEGPINGGKGSYLVGGRYFIPDLPLRIISISSPDNAEPIPIIGFYDITAKINYDISKKSTIYGSFYTGRDAFSAIFNESSVTSMGDVTQIADKSRTKMGLNWGNIVGSIRLSSKISDRSFFNLTTYYSHLSNVNFSEYKGKDKFISSNIKSKMGELGLKANMNHNLNDWYNLTYGLNLAYQNFVPQQISLNRDGNVVNTKYGDRNLYSGNAFVNNKFHLNDFSVNLGGRLSVYNNNRESKIVFEPRTSITYYKGNNSVWASYTLNTQPLFSMAQNMLSLPIDYWIPFQNKNELPISNQFTIGYKRIFEFGLEVQSEIYYKRSKNISIIYNTTDFLLDDGGYKLSNGEAYGFEFLGQYTYNRFNIMASYTYSKSQITADNKTFDFLYDTPHNLNILTSYKTLIKKNKTHTLSMNVNYKSGLPYFVSNEQYPMEESFANWYNNLINYPIYPNSRLTNFFRVDLNYTMEKRLRKGSRVWQISILNATAYRNPYIVYPNEGNKYKAIQLIPFLPSFSYTRRF